MSASLFISSLALLLAVTSFSTNLWVGHRAAVKARKPVLVFIDDPAAGCWTVRNIGNGPALNVIVGQRKRGKWCNPVRLHPLAKEDVIELEWLGRVNDTGLGAEYFDSEGRGYTSTVGGELLHCYEGRHLPDWPAMERHGQTEVRRYWDVEPYAEDAPTWGEVASDFGA